MDPLKKSHNENCTQDLKNKIIFSAIRDNDPILQEKIGKCLRLVYKEQLVKKIILPQKSLSPEALATIEEKSFEEALSLFFNDIRLKKFNPGKGKYEDYLFLLFKRVYLGHLSQKLGEVRQEDHNNNEMGNTASGEVPFMTGGYDITLNTAAVLKQLPQSSKDYFIWYYIDKFNLSQIITITGLTAGTVKENLWTSRKSFSHTWKQLFNFPGGDIITQQQYFLLWDYFENNLSGENEKLLRHLLSGNLHLQENFEHELYLRYGINKTILLAQTSQRSNEPFQSAEEFISRVKQVAESSSPKKFAKP